MLTENNSVRAMWFESDALVVHTAKENIFSLKYQEVPGLQEAIHENDTSAINHIIQREVSFRLGALDNRPN